jgi:N-acetylglucosamine kinase
MLCGGIDFGGTKIEARLFDGVAAQTVETRRLPTPTSSFEEMIDCLADQIGWLDRFSPGLPVGVAVPGVVDPVTQESYAANIPATGRAIAPTLEARLQRRIPVLNDGMAFTYSEAHGGAAETDHAVVGLTLGTGVGGGYCIGSEPAYRHAGIAIEVAHTGLPARAMARHGLPMWDCGCGRPGCYETAISGTGLARIARWKLGADIATRDLPAHPRADEVMEIWADLAAECFQTVQLMLDPDSIVLGGGLSNLPGVLDRLNAAFARYRFGPVRQPVLRIARHGDSSGARGVALYARKETSA